MKWKYTITETRTLTVVSEMNLSGEEIVISGGRDENGTVGAIVESVQLIAEREGIEWSDASRTLTVSMA